jgi:hypothetical protein
MNIDTPIPIQRQMTWYAKLFKKFLRTQVGKRVGFYLGLRGFNRVSVIHLRNYKVLSQGFVFNARVDKGAAQQASLMTGTSLGSITTPLPAKYIALSTSSLTPVKTDTTLTGETVVAGLARVLGTIQNYVAPSTLDGAASYDVYNSFTLTGVGTTVVSTALFDAASTGNMFAEVNFASSAVMATNDILQVTWTVNI